MDQKKKPGLFADFPPVSTKEWEDKIQVDLKGADYEKRLIWKSPGGLKIKPYYREEDLENLPHTKVLPGESPYIRGKKIKYNDWIIRQDFETPDPSEANKLALQAIDKGVDAVGFNATEVTAEAEMKTLLNGIDPETIHIHLVHGKSYPELLDYLIAVTGNKKSKGSLNFDPLGYFVLYNKFYGSQEGNFQEARNVIEKAKSKLPGFFVLCVNGQHYHNAGASVVQELAFSLSQGNEYLARLTEMGLSVDDIAKHMQFSFGAGSNYFLEIAKLRVARMLWAQIVKQYKPADEDSEKMQVHVYTSNWNKTLYDPYVNLLRTTTEAMSGSIGGADSMTVEPFDTTYKRPDEFSYRMARNQQIILKTEAYFNKVADPAAGSYYVENLCDSIAKAAWDLFLEIEEKGGFIQYASNGLIRSEVEEVCQKRDMDIAMRKQVFVGTNKYPNTGERKLDKVEPRAKLSDLSGLRQYRGTQAFEALRMAVENHANKGFETPRVFMFTYGDPAMRKARASFASNFFGVAGYKIIDNLGFPDIESGVKAAIESGAEIVVLCSSDPEYLEMAPAASQIKQQSPDTQVVVAGNPKEAMDELNQAGVDHYVHVRTNVLEALTRYNELLEIV
ncbi:MAG: methylmalonyl-CoA mutase family protein [Bacteroidales bacterium]